MLPNIHSYALINPASSDQVPRSAPCASFPQRVYYSDLFTSHIIVCILQEPSIASDPVTIPSPNPSASPSRPVSTPQIIPEQHGTSAKASKTIPQCTTRDTTTWPTISCSHPTASPSRHSVTLSHNSPSHVGFQQR